MNTPKSMSNLNDHEQTLLDSLRIALATGNVQQAHEIAERIQKEGGTKLQKVLHFVGPLIGVLKAIGSGDDRTGLKQLRELLESPPENVNEHLILLWTIWYWTARAAQGAGEGAQAKEAALRAHDIARGLDDQTKALSLSSLGEIEYLCNEYAPAMQHLDQAEKLYREENDRRGMAIARLARARILDAVGRGSACKLEAQTALTMDPTWALPIVFLARRLAQEGKIDDAHHTLRLLERFRPRPYELDSEGSLFEIFRKRCTPASVIASFYKLRRSLPSSETVDLLKALIDSGEDFPQIRVALAWKLLKLGRNDEAWNLFESLLKEDLDKTVRTSVEDGLRCLDTGKSAESSVDSFVPVPTDGATSQWVAKKKETKKKPSKPPRPSLDPPETPIPMGKPALACNLRYLAASDILQLLNTSRLTGTVTFTSTKGSGAIYLHQGLIIGAMSPQSLRLGQLLMAEGKITRKELKIARQAQAQELPDEQIGAILVEKGLVDRESVQRALVQQVYFVLGELMSWNRGKLVFSQTRAPEDIESLNFNLQLDPLMVILETAQRMDEDGR